MNNTLKNWIIGGAITATVATGGVVTVDNQIDPYVDKGSYYELSLAEDKVEISKTEAEVTLNKWGGEEQITVKRVGDFKTSERSLLSTTRSIETQDGKEAVLIEPLNENSVKVDILLNENPNTNVFDLEIEGYENFDFFYQPELTKEEIAEGVEQPEDVVGSYAVYHKTKKNHIVGQTNYQTGKAFHIYRPKVIDSKGDEIWAELSYSNGILRVTVPQNFLDTAIYPVRVDPTFGYTSIGANNQNFCTTSAISRLGSAANLTGNATLDSIHLALRTASGSATLTTSVFVNTESGSSHPEVAYGEDDLSITTTTGFKTITMAGESLSGGNYVLSASCDYADLSGFSVFLTRDTTATNNFYLESFGTDYAASKEDPWTETASALTQTFSIYATYTEAPITNKQSVIWFD